MPLGPIVDSHVHLWDPTRFRMSWLDGNGILDKNFFGVPTQPYGFSNKAEGFLGPPSFEDAAIEIDADQTVGVDLVYHASGVAAEP